MVRWAVTRQRRTPRDAPSLAGSSDRTHSQPHQPLRLLVARRLKPSSWSRWWADRASPRRSRLRSGSPAHSQRSARCPGRHCLNLKLKTSGWCLQVGQAGLYLQVRRWPRWRWEEGGGGCAHTSLRRGSGSDRVSPFQRGCNAPEVAPGTGSRATEASTWCAMEGWAAFFGLGLKFRLHCCLPEGRETTYLIFAGLFPYLWSGDNNNSTYS